VTQVVARLTNLTIIDRSLRNLSRKWQQAFSPIAFEFGMAHDPSGMGTTTGTPLIGVNATKACPFAYGEGRFFNEPRKFVDVVPIVELLSLDQNDQQAFDFREAVFNGADATVVRRILRRFAHHDEGSRSFPPRDDRGAKWGFVKTGSSTTSPIKWP